MFSRGTRRSEGESEQVSELESEDAPGEEGQVAPDKDSGDEFTLKITLAGLHLG